MQVDGHPQLLRLGEDRPVAFVVEIRAARDRARAAEVGMRLPAFEAQFLDGPLELSRGRVGILRRQCRETHESIGMTIDSGGQLVVDLLREACSQ